MGILDFFFSNHFKVLRVEYYFNSYFNPKSHVVGINDDTSFLLSSVTDFKNPPNTEILRCFRLFPKTCTNIRKNILIELGNDQTKKIDMEKMYNIFFEKNKIDPTVQIHEKYPLHICILNPITKEIILNRLYDLQNHECMDTVRGQQGDAVEWFFTKLQDDEIMDNIKSFYFKEKKQVIIVSENNLQQLETCDTQNVHVLTDRVIPNFYICHLGHYIQIIQHHCAYEIIVREAFDNVEKYLEYNRQEIQKSRYMLETLEREDKQQLKSHYQKQIDDYKNENSQLERLVNEQFVRLDYKVRNRDIYIFPDEQEYLFVSTRLKDTLNMPKKERKKQGKKRKKKKDVQNDENTNHDNFSGNNLTTKMINYMKENNVVETLQIRKENGTLNFGLFAVIYGGNRQGGSHYFSLIQHHDAWYIHNDGQFYQYEGREIPFHCNGYQASYMVYVKDLESKIQNVGRGYDNTGTPGNLGNSCYLFAIIKVLLLLPGFKTKLRNFINENASRQNKDEFKWIKLYLQLYDLYFLQM